MQEKYPAEINSRFQLPVSVMPLFETEITGLGMVERAADALFAAADAVSREEAQVSETGADKQ